LVVNNALGCVIEGLTPPTQPPKVFAGNLCHFR
jgi:hypothetical protein